MAVDQKDPRVQEYLRQQEKEKSKKLPKKVPKKPPAEDSGKAQRRLFKKTRAGVTLTRDEVKAIKAGRKKLRRELRERGLKEKSDFELTASSLGLYFDKRRRALLMWLLRHWVGGLLALLGLILLTILLFSAVSHARGFFTINLTDGMFREGFTLSETKGFENPTTKLFSVPAENVPCISIVQLPVDLDEIDGQHNESYFAYTFYMRNEGETNVDYDWNLSFTAESRGLSRGIWVMLFEDGIMRIYAKADDETGLRQALPAFGDNSRGYRFLPVQSLAPESDQFQAVKRSGNVVWWRVIPDNFVDDSVIAEGTMLDVDPGEIHKYTVVIWLEGDDPDSTDELINGHAGVAMQFQLLDEEEGDFGNGVRWADLWDDLRFWAD